MYAIYFKENLPVKYKEELEGIFFFNPFQKKYIDRIRKVISDYGVPQLIIEDDFLYIVFNEKIRYKTLYAFESDSANAELLGLLIYELRNNQCNVIHLATHELCNAKNDHSGELVTLRLIEKLRRETLKDDTIKYINIQYTGTLLPTRIKLIDAWV